MKRIAPLALLLIGMLVACLPVLLAAAPPLVDYPNHLARMHIIGVLGASPTLGQFYELVWRPIPNLAMDLLVPLLALVVPLFWAGKIFLALTLLLLGGSTAALHRILFERWSVWPCLALLLLYNRNLLWGFANFLFGVGLALTALACWIGLRQRAPVLRHALVFVLALAIYFSHLFAFGAYGLLILGYELALWRQERTALLRRLSAVGGQFLLPIILFITTMGGGDGGMLSWSRIYRKLDILYNILDNYVPVLDIASFVVLVLLFALGFWRRAIRLAPALALPLLLLLLAQLAMPNRIFGAAGVDHRMPIVLALLLIASSEWIAAPHPWHRMLGAALAGLFLLRMLVISAVWLESDHETAPVINALLELPRGSRVAVAYPPASVHVPRGAPPVLHLAAYAVIGADAFVPTLFVDPGQQPLRYRPDYARLASLASPDDFWSVLMEGKAEPASRVAAALAQYDYIFFAGGGAMPQSTARLIKIIDGAGASLYAIKRP
jgi:hypothetical protein